MPLPPPTAPADPRVTAERARAQRTQRVERLRRQVIAAAVATFALAFGLVAFDGSMGAQSASSSTVTKATQQPPADDFGESDDSGQDAAPAPARSSQS